VVRFAVEPEGALHEQWAWPPVCVGVRNDPGRPLSEANVLWPSKEALKPSLLTARSPRESGSTRAARTEAAADSCFALLAAVQTTQAQDDRRGRWGRSRSSRCRGARSPAGTALSSSPVRPAGGWALPWHQRSVANTKLPTAADDEQPRSLTELLVDEPGFGGAALGFHKRSSARGRIADPPGARGSSGSTLSSTALRQLVSTKERRMRTLAEPRGAARIAPRGVQRLAFR
jgi:hypothetical protein